TEGPARFEPSASSPAIIVPQSPSDPVASNGVTGELGNGGTEKASSPAGKIQVFSFIRVKTAKFLSAAKANLSNKEWRKTALGWPWTYFSLWVSAFLLWGDWFTMLTLLIISAAAFGYTMNREIKTFRKDNEMDELEAKKTELSNLAGDLQSMLSSNIGAGSHLGRKIFSLEQDYRRFDEAMVEILLWEMKVAGEKLERIVKELLEHGYSDTKGARRKTAIAAVKWIREIYFLKPQKLPNLESREQKLIQTIQSMKQRFGPQGKFAKLLEEIRGGHGLNVDNAQEILREMHNTANSLSPLSESEVGIVQTAEKLLDKYLKARKAGEEVRFSETLEIARAAQKAATALEKRFVDLMVGFVKNALDVLRQEHAGLLKFCELNLEEAVKTHQQLEAKLKPKIIWRNWVVGLTVFITVILGLTYLAQQVEGWLSALTGDKAQAAGQTAKPTVRPAALVSPVAPIPAVDSLLWLKNAWHYISGLRSSSASSSLVSNEKVTEADITNLETKIDNARVEMEQEQRQRNAGIDALFAKLDGLDKEIIPIESLRQCFGNRIDSVIWDQVFADKSQAVTEVLATLTKIKEEIISLRKSLGLNGVRYVQVEIAEYTLSQYLEHPVRISPDLAQGIIGILRCADSELKKSLEDLRCDSLARLQALREERDAMSACQHKAIRDLEARLMQMQVELRKSQRISWGFVSTIGDLLLDRLPELISKWLTRVYEAVREMVNYYFVTRTQRKPSRPAKLSKVTAAVKKGFSRAMPASADFINRLFLAIAAAKQAEPVRPRTPLLSKVTARRILGALGVGALAYGGYSARDLIIRGVEFSLPVVFTVLVLATALLLLYIAWIGPPRFLSQLKILQMAPVEHEIHGDIQKFKGLGMREDWHREEKAGDQSDLARAQIDRKITHGVSRGINAIFWVVAAAVVTLVAVLIIGSLGIFPPGAAVGYGVGKGVVIKSIGIKGIAIVLSIVAVLSGIVWLLVRLGRVQKAGEKKHLDRRDKHLKVIREDLEVRKIDWAAFRWMTGWMLVWVVMPVAAVWFTSYDAVYALVALIIGMTIYGRQLAIGSEEDTKIKESLLAHAVLFVGLHRVWPQLFCFGGPSVKKWGSADTQGIGGGYSQIRHKHRQTRYRAEATTSMMVVALAAAGLTGLVLLITALRQNAFDHPLNYWPLMALALINLCGQYLPRIWQNYHYLDDNFSAVKKARVGFDEANLASSEPAVGGGYRKVGMKQVKTAKKIIVILGGILTAVGAAIYLHGRFVLDRSVNQSLYLLWLPPSLTVFWWIVATVAGWYVWAKYTAGIKASLEKAGKSVAEIFWSGIKLWLKRIGAFIVTLGLSVMVIYFAVQQIKAGQLNPEAWLEFPKVLLNGLWIAVQAIPKAVLKGAVWLFNNLGYWLTVIKIAVFGLTAFVIQQKKFNTWRGAGVIAVAYGILVWGVLPNDAEWLIKDTLVIYPLCISTLIVVPVAYAIFSKVLKLGSISDLFRDIKYFLYTTAGSIAFALLFSYICHIIGIQNIADFCVSQWHSLT
ncbi:MAG: hypothetical protein ACOY3D_07150, partial [Candidatus Omnitrophota bacterium]